MDTTLEAVSNSISLRNQQQSPLLRLPAELRNKIYILAISGHEIDVVLGFDNERYTAPAANYAARQPYFALNTFHGHMVDLPTFFSHRNTHGARIASIGVWLYRFPRLYSNPGAFWNARDAAQMSMYSKLRKSIELLGSVKQVHVLVRETVIENSGHPARVDLLRRLLGLEASELAVRSGTAWKTLVVLKDGT